MEVVLFLVARKLIYAATYPFLSYAPPLNKERNQKAPSPSREPRWQELDSRAVVKP